ncbi:MAG: hypothetical protein ABL998_14750, partial [Planctomycetota bacterium]
MNSVTGAVLLLLLGASASAQDAHPPIATPADARLRGLDSLRLKLRAEGVPIREEIVSEHDAAVITRNGYGARCLNTPNV